jgi:hypothetical protein
MILIKSTALPLFDLPDKLYFYSQLLQSVADNPDDIDHIETGLLSPLLDAPL